LRGLKSAPHFFTASQHSALSTFGYATAMRIRFSVAVAIILFLAFPALAARRAAKKPAAATSITVDTHADTPTEWMEHPFDLGVLNTHGHFDYPRMKAGGL